MTDRVLVVGVGGLGCPAATALARARVPMTLLDDDVVSASNLHRQTLFTRADVGAPKAETAARRLRDEGADVESVEGRLLPDTAASLVERHAAVVEGADNHATKFLAFDTAFACGRPIAQAGAVRLEGWAFASVPGRGPCFRCLFEAMPESTEEACDVAGILGPVAGVLGALLAADTLRFTLGDATPRLTTYDASRGRLRRATPTPRPDCPACAASARFRA